eukprot:5012829-Pleurochrysis_carterae.AAC.1
MLFLAGAMLFLATPQLVSHRIDRWSPFYPPEAFEGRNARLTTPRPRDEELNFNQGQRIGLWAERPVFPGLVQREEDLDAEDAIDQEITRRRRLRKKSLLRISKQGPPSPPVPQQQPSEECKPRQGLGVDLPSLTAFREKLREHVRKSEIEVIVVVEAIDPSSSNTFQ